MWCFLSLCFLHPSETPSRSKSNNHSITNAMIIWSYQSKLGINLPSWDFILVCFYITFLMPISFRNLESGNRIVQVLPSSALHIQEDRVILPHCVVLVFSQLVTTAPCAWCLRHICLEMELERYGWFSKTRTKWIELYGRCRDLRVVAGIELK